MSGTYDGDPIDMSWKSGPWANDGETVDVVDSEGDGKMDVDEWPEDATDPRELNDDQRAAIMAAVRNPQEDRWAELTRKSGVDNNRGYCRDVLKYHWPRKYEEVKERTIIGGVEPAVPDSDIEDVRARALDGESTLTIAEDYGVDCTSVGSRLKGERGDDSNSDIPPLEWDMSNQEWYIPDSGTEAELIMYEPDKFEKAAKEILSEVNYEDKPTPEKVESRLRTLVTEYDISFDDAKQDLLYQYTTTEKYYTDTEPTEVEQTDTDEDEEVSEPTEDIETSPVYKQQDGTDTSDTTGLKAVALLALGFILGRLFAGGSDD